METLMLLTYAALCWVVFKVFRIPVNKWSLTTAVLGGVVMIGSLLMGMAYFHPGSRSARIYYVTTQIVPNVKGKVIEVDVKPNVPVKKGTVLLKIDPTPYQAKVDQIQAELDYAKQMLQDSIRLMQSAGGSKFDVEKWKKEVASLKAQLEQAKFDLDSCVVRAPSDGYVTQLRVRPGQMAVPIPALPLMTFVNSDSAKLIAGFGQEPVRNIKKGDPAEAIFVAVPGRTFQGKVEKVLPALAEGELNANRNMVSFTQQLPAGQVPVIIQLDKNLSSLGLPLGVESTVAIYTAHEGFWSHVAIIRKVLLRMLGWSYFLRFH
ncbi:HlyD family secretion protein [Nitratifractor sp.]